MPERPEVFAEKFGLFSKGCLVLESERQTVGYGFAHPWTRDDIPALDAFLTALHENTEGVIASADLESGVPAEKEKDKKEKKKTSSKDKEKKKDSSDEAGTAKKPAPEPAPAKTAAEKKPSTGTPSSPAPAVAAAAEKG